MKAPIRQGRGGYLRSWLTVAVARSPPPLFPSLDQVLSGDNGPEGVKVKVKMGVIAQVVAGEGRM